MAKQIFDSISSLFTDWSFSLFYLLLSCMYCFPYSPIGHPIVIKPHRVLLWILKISSMLLYPLLDFLLRRKIVYLNFSSSFKLLVLSKNQILVSLPYSTWVFHAIALIFISFPLLFCFCVSVVVFIAPGLESIHTELINSSWNLFY